MLKLWHLWYCLSTQIWSPSDVVIGRLLYRPSRVESITSCHPQPDANNVGRDELRRFQHCDVRGTHAVHPQHADAWGAGRVKLNSVFKLIVTFVF